MTDSVTHETHGDGTLSGEQVAQGLIDLQSAELAQQLEQQNAVDAAADALETLDEAGAVANQAAELELELEATLGAVEPLEASPEELAEWEQEVISGIAQSETYADEGRFYARITTQLVELRQATRIAQIINSRYPTWLQDRRAQGLPELNVEAVFDRARACASAVFSLLSATVRTLEQCDPPEMRSPVAQAPGSPAARIVAQAVGGGPSVAKTAGTVERRGPLPPANRPAPVKPTPITPHGPPPQYAGRAPARNPELELDQSLANVDPVRARVVAVQKEAERKRQLQKNQSRARNNQTSAPQGRIAPQTRNMVMRPKAHGPMDGRRIEPERDALGAIVREARGLMGDLRRKARSVDRERATRFCNSMIRLGEQGLISEKLWQFATAVVDHQSPANLVKLAGYFVNEHKSRSAA